MGENAADKTAENISPDNGGDEVFRYLSKKEFKMPVHSLKK